MTAAASVPSAAFTPLKRLKQFVDVVMKMFDDEKLNGICGAAGRSPDTLMLPRCLRF